MVLRNHGVVACGESIEEALFLMQNVVLACETQIKLMSCGLENIQIMSNEAIEQVRSVIKAAGSHVQGKPGTDDSSVMASNPEPNDHKEKLKKWKVWDLEFEAQMRMLDNAVRLLIYWFPFDVIIIILFSGIPNGISIQTTTSQSRSAQD